MTIAALPLVSCRYATPLGEMLGLFTPRGLCLLEFTDGTARMDTELRQVEAATRATPQASQNAHTQALGEQLVAYFDGRLRDFDLPLDLVGTPFQQQVWRALLEIGYGQTWSYGQEAQHIGRPTATRAVAAANGQNKIAIVVPCHRVIGANGTLTGYGGGLPRKRWLLALEQAGAPPRDLLDGA